jgi:hypothetical protein
MILVTWVFVAAVLTVQHVPTLLANGVTDPDSQTRLVEVRDYLAGAPWTDLHQMRLAPPDGVLMHWSRLIDWPIATLIRITQPFTGREMAEIIAVTAWPLLLYLVFFFGITAVAKRLAGPDALFPALAFAIFASPATGMFMPGHITHHNAQIALFSVLLALVVRIDRGEVIGIFAGVTAALMMAIGLETLPLIGIIGGGLALTWAFSPERIRPGLNGFGLFFGTAMVVQRAFTAAPNDWLAAPCDIASAPYVMVALIGGLGLAGLMRINPSSMLVRLAGLGVLGVCAVAALGLINPHCLKGPYAEVDPRIIPLWLSNVQEAQSFGQLATNAPSQLVGLFLVPFLALVPTSWAFAWSGRSERAGWGLVLVLLMTAITVAMWEVRGSTFASILVVPGMAYAVTEVRRWCAARGTIVLALGLLLIYTVPNQAAQTIVADLIRQRFEERPAVPSTPGQSTIAGPAQTPTETSPQAGYARCASQGNYTTLAIQPKGIVLIESNLGPSILLNTPHSTIAAPYHRNGAGIFDAFSALEGSSATAYDVVSRRHVTYVAACPADPEVDVIQQVAPDGFLARLLKGDVPAWLQPVAIPGPLKLWRVTAPAGSTATDPTPTGSVRSHGSAPPPVPDLRGSLAP